MRIQSIYEVNTHLHESPFFSQNAGESAIGNTNSLISFEECLRAQFQKAKPNAKTIREKNRAYNAPAGSSVPIGFSASSVLLLRTLSYLPLMEFVAT